MVALYCAFRDRVSVVALNLAPLAGLAMLDVIRRVRDNEAQKWGWILAGIYVMGPASMQIAGMVAGFSSGTDQSGSWLWFILLCLLPSATFWFATLNGMIVSVLLTTLLLIILAGLEKDRRVRD